MNTQEYKDDYLDDVFRQVMQPYANAKSPNTVWECVQWRVETVPPSQWQRVLARFTRFSTFHWSISHQPICIELNRYRPSPFLSVMVKQMLDVKLAS